MPLQWGPSLPPVKLPRSLQAARQLLGREVQHPSFPVVEQGGAILARVARLCCQGVSNLCLYLIFLGHPPLAEGCFRK